MAVTVYVTGVLKVGGTTYYKTYSGANSSFTNYTYTWTTNPKTGVAWTADDVNGVGTNGLEQFGVSSYSSEDVDYWVCHASQIYITVTYTLPPERSAGGSGSSSGKMSQVFNFGSA